MEGGGEGGRVEEEVTLFLVTSSLTTCFENGCERLLISVSQMLSGIYSKNIYLSFREMYNIPLFTVSYIFFHSECVENQVLLTA